MRAEESFTVLGASGFVGTCVVAALRGEGVDPRTPERGEPLRDALGHVIDARGVTSDFRARPFDTVRAHVTDLAQALEHGRFSSFLYLSSTRVYRGLDGGTEDAVLRIAPADPDDLYALSKLLGESLCLSRAEPGVRVARLSHVYGAGDPSASVLASLVRGSSAGREVRLRSALDSRRDWVLAADVAPLLVRIARGGRQRLYNVASGVQTSHREIVATLAALGGCRVRVEPHAPVVSFPPIDVTRIHEEFGFVATPLADGLRAILGAGAGRIAS